jgi:hypothetical protein
MAGFVNMAMNLWGLSEVWNLKSVYSTKGPCLCLHKVCRRSQHRIDRVYILTNCIKPVAERNQGTCVDQGLTKSPTGNRGGLMFSRPAEAVPKKKAKSAQRVVSNYSAALTEVFRALPQL